MRTLSNNRAKTSVLAIVMASASWVALAAPPANAQGDEAERVEETIFVVGDRQAYKGNFDPLEVPAADLTIDAELLADAGALNLSDALDLSAAVARQNNFGELWNAFSIRGFASARYRALETPDPHARLGRPDLRDGRA